MNSQVELSVVVPVYNGEDFIGQTITSILSNSQGFNVECIVIDDGSTDRTPDILATFSGKVRIHRQENAGESAAVNKGFQLASGDFVVVVSADDPVLTPKLFNGVVRFFENSPRVVAWYPDWNVIDENDRVLKKIVLPEYDFKDLFSRNRVLPGPGTWIRKQAALDIGGRQSKWKYVGDYDFWLRLSRIGNLAHRSEVLAQWRKHSRSTSISERGSEMALERIAVIEDFVSTHKETLDEREISLARAHACYLAARLGYFSLEVNSRVLFVRSLKLDYRVLKSIRLYEALFMISFPLSKKLLDLVWKFR